MMNEFIIHHSEFIISRILMLRVVSIGQCGFDHASIANALRREFGAEVVAADDLESARPHFDPPPALVLVNRKLDADGGDGLAIVRDLKADTATSAIPVMLVSNYPEYQAQAVRSGAVEGFGKAELGAAKTLDKFRPFLKS